MDDKKMNIKNWPRHTIQALWAALTNSHISGFVTGKIYTGKLKNACVPGLNCYSCPGQQEPVQLDPYRPWLEAGTLNLPTT